VKKRWIYCPTVLKFGMLVYYRSIKVAAECWICRLGHYEPRNESLKRLAQWPPLLVLLCLRQQQAAEAVCFRVVRSLHVRWHLFRVTLYLCTIHTLCSKKSYAKIQITITTTYFIRIKYPLSGFNYHLSNVNFANFNKIHRKVSEQQLF